MMKKIPIPKNESGQVLVIVAVSFVVLLLFVGLAIDGTQLFLNYTRLKRAVDAAAVAAANDFRKESNLDRMKQSALEVLDMQQVRGAINLEIYRCDNDGDGFTDTGPGSIESTVPDFFKQCPKPGQTQRKLIYVRAFENSPTNFMTLIGIHSIPITTNAIVEAAPVDLVIVLDTSKSMGSLTTGYTQDYDPNADPGGCNLNNTCEPLLGAKSAAKELIDKLYPDYDQVAIVSYDTVAQLRYALGNLNDAPAALDSLPLNDAPSPNFLPFIWRTSGLFNWINPDDRDNNGADPDPDSPTCEPASSDGTSNPNGPRWDYSKPNGGIPCDNPAYYDAFDWNQDGSFHTDANSSGICPNPDSPAADDDHCRTKQWMANPIHNPLALPALPPISLVSTCTGCGIRVATEQLTMFGRPNAVWVMVFMTDGVTNMSDTPQTFAYDANTKVGVDSAYFPNGYCGGWIATSAQTADPNRPNYWLTQCQDKADKKTSPALRHCIKDLASACPPGSTWIDKTTITNHYSAYSVVDYAMDMTDIAALQESTNVNEKIFGNNIAFYTVMFSNTDALISSGAPLLRYMAAVGDDGNRETDPCVGKGVKEKCGQYYWAGNTKDLTRVFLDIASRIYTKISE
jgi:hypothetical protein